MSKIILRILSAICLVIGIYFIAWEIANSQTDQYLFYGIVLCVAGILCLIFSFRVSESPESENRPSRPKCVNHERYESIGFCEVCRKPFCEECLSKVYGKYYCHTCKEPFLQKISHLPFKSKTAAVLLCLFLGLFGIHRIYLGHTSGAAILIFHVIFLPTTLLFYMPIVVYAPVSLILAIVALIDLINIALGNMSDNYGRDLV